MSLIAAFLLGIAVRSIPSSAWIAFENWCIAQFQEWKAARAAAKAAKAAKK